MQYGDKCRTAYCTLQFGKRLYRPNNSREA